MLPYLDVVMRTHDSALHLPGALASLAEQTYPCERLKLIVADASSSDDTLQILQRWGQDMPFGVEVVTVPAHAPEPVAFNAALSSTSAPYIFFLRPHSLLRDNALESLATALSSSDGAAFAYSGYVRLIPSDVDRGEEYQITLDAQMPPPFSAQRLRDANHVAMMSMVRREHLPEPPFDEQFERFHNWDLWLSLVGRGLRGVPVEEMLFYEYVLPGPAADDPLVLATREKVIRKHASPEHQEAS